MVSIALSGPAEVQKKCQNDAIQLVTQKGDKSLYFRWFQTNLRRTPFDEMGSISTFDPLFFSPNQIDENEQNFRYFQASARGSYHH